MKKKIFIAIVLGLILINPISLSKDDFIQKQETVSTISLEREMVTSPLQQEEKKVYSTAILNVRREPSLSAEVVALIPKNAEMIFVENVNESWIKININETEYFVNSNYISETALEQDIIQILQIENHNEIYFVNEFNQEVDNPNLVSLGEFKLTAYCSCSICCEGWANKREKDAYGNDIVRGSTGERLYEGLSIAVDPTVIPYRSEVVIGSNTYVAHDCGGAIKSNKIDVYFEDHDTAKQFGVQYEEIFLWKY